MFDTIILLTGPAEQEPLAPVLKQHNPQLTILPARTLGDLEAIERRLLPRAPDRVSHLVLAPNRMLSRLG